MALKFSTDDLTDKAGEATANDHVGSMKKKSTIAVDSKVARMPGPPPATAPSVAQQSIHSCPKLPSYCISSRPNRFCAPTKRLRAGKSDEAHCFCAQADPIVRP